MALLRRLAVAVLLGGPLVAQGLAAGDVERALVRHGCQTELPGEAAAGPDGAAASSARERRGERSGAPAKAPSPGWRLGLPMPPIVATILLWTIVGLAVVWLVVAIARGVLARRDAAPPPAAPRRPPPAATAGAAGALPDPEQFAAAGDFAGAVHALLQRAFAIWAQSGGLLPAAATAREVLRQVQGRRVPAEPLRRLVHAVELVHFGGRAADGALYAAARVDLERWEAACPAPK
ncbi:MAG: DUF4129 domain-containing protein [Planctomycetes bacterium]|nr:DUF4129 domain-containing protein [Planctomycetota bacterium]